MSNKNVERILETSMEEVLHNSMLPYAEYVIMDRAIPRVEDGLKPVQRRILYAMSELGITPEKPTRKSARIVGDCLGKYHPHGDTSVYGALVRMGQNFSVRNTLIFGQGNFGSVDGDGAAAMRYTEAKLTPLAMELLRDIDKNTVNFTNNFDDTLVEPVTLPGHFPNLLVNGASGIAVGLATNIPTHNLSEVIDGTISMIRNPNINLEELMKYIKAPDFPTGGYIITEDLKKAYRTGKGKIFIRAKAKIDIENGKEVIVITELPYQVNKALLQRKIIMLRETRRAYNKNDITCGITGVVDESDMNGMRVVIKVKKDYSAREILELLYKKTDLQISFNINMVAIADGKPKQLSLIEILKAYIKYQMTVVLRRSTYQFDEATKRKHILDGLYVAVQAIDEVIHIIRTSKNTPEAKSRLRETFSLSSEQAQAILDMRLAKLNSLEVYKLEKEIQDLDIKITNLNEIIHSEDKRKSVLVTELLEIKRKFGDARRSEIVDEIDEIVIRNASEKIIEPCIIELLADGGIRKIKPLANGGRPKVFTSFEKVDNIVVESISSTTNKIFRAFSNKGYCYKFSLDSFEFFTPTSRKRPELPFEAELDLDENIVSIFEVDDDGAYLFVTKKGYLKRSGKSEYNLRKDAFAGIKLEEDDELIDILNFDESKELFFATRKGMCLRFMPNDIPMQGRVSKGVRGIKLNENDYVINLSCILEGGEIYVITSSAFIKRIDVDTVPSTSRYCKGVKLIQMPTNNYVVAAGFINKPVEFAVIADTKDVTLLLSNSIPMDRREGKGSYEPSIKYFKAIEKVYELK